jgi:hypothetical protein
MIRRVGPPVTVGAGIATNSRALVSLLRTLEHNLSATTGSDRRFEFAADNLPRESIARI